MPATPARRERPTSAQVFTVTEMQAMLRCARVLTPTGPDEWEIVWTRYRATFAKVKHRAVRNPAFLRDKFEALLASGSSTVKPSPELREAREIQALIEAKQSRAAKYGPQKAGNGKPLQPATPDRRPAPNGRTLGPREAPLHVGAPRKPKAAERKPAQAPAQSTPSPEKPRLRPGERRPAAGRTHDHTPQPAAVAKPAGLKRPVHSSPAGPPSLNAKKRRVETAAVTDVEEQAERVVLKLQLQSEMAERQRLQHKVDRLEMKMDDLRDSHRKEVEKLRSKNLKLKLKLNRIMGALCVLRATQPTETA